MTKIPPKPKNYQNTPETQKMTKIPLKPKKLPKYPRNLKIPPKNPRAFGQESWVYLGHFKGLGVFLSLYRFEGILVIL